MDNKVLEQYLNQLLSIELYQDYTVNGLQIEGRQDIQSVICGVTASKQLIDVAVAEKADALLVHHGYFWKNESPAITGYKKERIATLLNHGINLYAYHLPLDAHPTLGNNIGLANKLGIQNPKAVSQDGLIWTGELSHATAIEAFLAHVSQVLGREAMLLGQGMKTVHKVAWCTGAAQSMFEAAAAFEVDVFISGEVSEQTFHLANELGIYYIAAGHHATEREGVMALNNVLKNDCKLKSQFVDCFNPV